jgi:hypothetical protein
MVAMHLDPCLFIKVCGPSKVYMLCHVDDTIVWVTDYSKSRIFQEQVKRRFAITNQSSVEEYLGIKLVSDPSGNCLMTQPKLLDQAFEEYADELARYFPRSTSAPQRKKEMQSEDDTLVSQTSYLRLLGILNYLTKTRPDISTACSFGATHAAHPTQGHMLELLHCLHYLKCTRDMGLGSCALPATWMRAILRMRTPSPTPGTACRLGKSGPSIPSPGSRHWWPLLPLMQK